MTLKIIGAGLGRTGTASLKIALEQLGIGRCYHMGELLSNLDTIPLWVDAADGKPDWNKLLGAYSATLDYPACSFWRQLMEHYPDAKVLLSTRDATSWFNSVNETIFSSLNNDWLVQQENLVEFFEKCVWKDFPEQILDREFMVAYYQRRIDEVIATVPSERLLVYEVKQGWAPLCQFLELDIPDTPFPRVNSRDDTRQMLESRIRIEKDDSFQRSMKEQAEKLFT